MKNVFMQKRNVNLKLGIEIANEYVQLLNLKAVEN
jgi:hypothetical protein